DELDNNKYEFTVDIQSSDAEDKEIIEKHISISESCESSWSHSSDGYKHSIKLIAEAYDSSRTLSINVIGNSKFGLEEGNLINVTIPSKNEMSILDVSCVRGDERYIEVIFSKKLDPSQNINGLANIVDKNTRNISVSKNRLRIYPAANVKGEVSIFVSGSIRAHNGATLGEDKTYSVTLDEIKPQVEFLKAGEIIPLSDNVSVPFRAIMLKGVHVDIYRIYHNNFGQMLQMGNINDINNLRMVGRPIASKTIFFDGNFFDQWRTYAINLSEMFTSSPGDMYRIELKMDYNLSAWPDITQPTLSREDIEKKDAERLKSLNNLADADNRWESSYYEWEDYDWREKNNPATKSYYANKSVVKNVCATNIGLLALNGRGANAPVRIVASDIPSAKALEGVNVNMYNFQNQVVASGTTNSDGEISLSYNIASGKPHHIIASKGNDISCLLLTDNTSLSTSNFDVSGDIVQNGLKGYIYGERGVWRPGDTLHLSFMLSDRQNSLPKSHPVTLEVTNTLGQIQYKTTRSSGSLGIYSFDVPTSPDAPTGSWCATVSVGGTKFSKSLRIETIKPNRLKIDLNLPKLISSNVVRANMHTEWLSGAVARNLKYEIDADFSVVKTSFKGYDNYIFDDPTKEFTSDRQRVAEGTVNDNGDASLNFSTEVSSTAPGMLKMTLGTRLYEESGEYSIDASSALFAPYSSFVGVKAPASKDYLDTDKPHSFNVVSLSPDGSPLPNHSLEVRIFKTKWYWWWNSNSSDLASFISREYSSPKQAISVKTDANGHGSFQLNIPKNEWGTYYICIADKKSGHRTGIMSYFDWPSMYGRRSFEGQDGVSMLSLSTNKKEYEVGEDISISFPSSNGCRAIVSVCNGSSVLMTEYHECSSENTTIKIKATEDMRPNAYIQIFEVQPYSQTLNDMPIRLFGIAPITITSSKSILTPVISMTDEVRPETDVEVVVSEKDGRKMAYTLAIVDEGLLDLTHFQTPNAWNSFNAREALGVRFWDMYGLVAGAFGGRIEQMFSIGGDDFLNNGANSNMNRFTPMVHFAGPFILDGGKKKHKVHFPNYSGRVRVMVVAGDGLAYGNAEKSVKVTKPIMILPTMPRQVGVNDEATISAAVFSNANIKGEAKVSISCTDGIEVIGDNSKSVSLDANDNKTVSFRVKVSDVAKDCTITLTAKCDGESATVSTQLHVRRVSQRLTTTISKSIQPGQKFETKLSADNVMAEASAFEPFNLTSRLQYLIDYPHGCGEQITSRALPQLYLAKFSDLSKVQAIQVESNIKSVISRLSTYRTSDGGMSYWPNTNKTDLWVSAYIHIFITEAERQGYYVDADMKRQLTSYLLRQVKTWRLALKSYVTDEYSFALFALANSDNAELGTMNRLKEGMANLSSNSLINLAASYALVGQPEIARELLVKSGNKDTAMRLITLCKINSPEDKTEAESLRNSLLSDSWMSTRETALSIFAMSNYINAHPVAKEMAFSARLNNKEIADVKTSKMMWTENIARDVKSADFSIKNNGKSDINIRIVSVADVSQTDVHQNSNGLRLSASYLTEKGAPINIKELTQGETFKAIVSITNTGVHAIRNVALTHILPAGWEILKAEGSNGISYQDIRDDRVLSYIDDFAVGATHNITLILSATYAGSYYMPSISAEAMYDNTISACTASDYVTVK
ncbi:MAG: MG2 domain-containing protein, partial [Bacteroidia bacterium]|nr:MG2 domain-containing protein [Bacteroidia bacterium]